MEVRCGACNKLYRVSDDKVTGIGIKFPCTRCGAYVRITHEDLERYIMSHGASVPDLFGSISKPAAAPLQPMPAEPIAREEAASPGHESQLPVLTAQSTQEDMLEKKAPSFIEPEDISPAPAPQPEPTPELEPVVSQQQANSTLEKETLPELPIQPAMPKREYATPVIPPVSPATERIPAGSIRASTPTRSGNMFYVLIGTLIIVGLAGYGIFVNLQPPSPQLAEKVVQAAITIEGLQIVNPVGSVEANGDLLLSGTIENSLDKERAVWYIVLEIYDAQGAVLSKIRLLNGNQIYSQRDYDILAKRGTNVQEFKEKLLQRRGIVIPPKGRINFEVRYLEPPRGIASFVAQPLPFDPGQLQKEIEREIK